MFEKTSLQRIRHIFNSEIHPIVIRKQCPELEQFVYDYSFGLKADSDGDSMKIWTLSHVISNLMDVNKSDDDVIIISGKMIQPDYAILHVIKNKHKAEHIRHS